jgi:hypothetical protein
MWAAQIAQSAVQEVVYQRAQDAQTAIRKYNDVPLDGFNMVRLRSLLRRRRRGSSSQRASIGRVARR